MPLIRVDHAGMQGLVHSLAAVAETFDVLPQPLRNRADDAAAAAGSSLRLLELGVVHF